ncbi:MAG TPA: alkaline phosphatase family protein [Acidimicrobiia bacterium]|nr:alkaline phosphatase family protein [Acidimicrobiia bacterium]
MTRCLRRFRLRPQPRARRWWLSASLGAVLIGQSLAPATATAAQSPPGSADRPFDFGAIGDTRITADEQARFPNLVEDMNRAGLAFSVHDGNIGADPDACLDGAYEENRDLFDRFRAPLVYTPGDNEWLACRTEGMDPVQRLAALRKAFFSSDRSRGTTPLRLDRQTPAYPENARWRHGSVTFATLHVVGSHDDLGAPEFAPRRAATERWLKQTFDRARQDHSAGVVLVWQADPFFQQEVPAYNGLRGALRAETLSFGKPVLLIHGDSGRFGVDKPMLDPQGQTVANFTRLQTFGPADVAWVRVTVDPGARDVFSFRAEMPPGPAVGPVPPPAPCGTKAAPPAVWQHVIWIWMENKQRDDVLGNPAAPYETGLAAACGTARQYSSVARPSLPNYLAATSGRTFGVTDDAPPAAHNITADNLFRQVRARGLDARSYQEDMPGPCVLETTGLYAVKHNPAAYYRGGDDRAACRRDNLPLGSTVTGPFAQALDDDTLPAFSFITPNLCNDTHDCPVKRGDVWLSVWLRRILSSQAYLAGTTAVFVMWDEATIIPNIIISPTTRPGTAPTAPFDHYSALRTTEEMLGIPTHLGRAAQASSMRSAFKL